MDALSRIFMQVDQIKHDHPHEDPPPWMPEEQAKPETPKPEQVVPAPEVKPHTPKPIEPKPSTVLSTETANRAELNRLGFKENWNDVRAQKQDNAAALLEQRLQESREDRSAGGDHREEHAPGCSQQKTPGQNQHS